eukprot:Gb_12282 [translate_table: standard]
MCSISALEYYNIMGTWSSWTVVMLLMAVAASLTSAAVGPSPQQIIADKAVISAVATAWKESILGDDKYHTRGGWVYADATNPTKLVVRLADKCRSLIQTNEIAKNNSELVEIYLDYPENDKSSPPPPLGYKIVADFHTHPYPSYPTPDEDDVERAYNRDVPGLVYSCKGIFLSGPQRRASLAGPPGYPGNCFKYMAQNYTPVGDTHFPNCPK